METWKPVLAFEGIYEVSDTGAVRRVGCPDPLKPFVRGGYPSVSLKDRGRRQTKAVHVAVLEAFVEPRPPRRYGAHMDGNPNNPALTNLAWVTQSENEAHKIGHGTGVRGDRSPHAKLTNEQAATVREIVAAGIKQWRLARLLGMSEDAVSKIVRGLTYADH